MANWYVKAEAAFGQHGKKLAVTAAISYAVFIGMLLVNAGGVGYQYYKTSQDMTSVKAKVEQLTGAISAVEQSKNEQVRRDMSSINQDETWLSYWRKQWEIYGKLKPVTIKLLGRTISPYEGAIRLDVLLQKRTSIQQGPDGKDISTTEGTNTSIAQALDFLQLYGYVESFDGQKVVLHVSKEYAQSTGEEK